MKFRETYLQCFSAFLLALLVLPASAQITSKQTNGSSGVNSITTAVPFLLIAPDSRSGGMGDVGAATEADANAIHWNPAKIVFNANQGGFGVSYSPWLQALVDDINLAYLSGYYKIDDQQAIAGSLLFFSLGNITFTDINGAIKGDFNPNEFALDGAYSRRLSDYVSVGTAIRFIYSNLAAGQTVNDQVIHPGTSIAADISAYYEKPLSLNSYDAVLGLGLNVSNIGTKISYTDGAQKDFIPTNLRLGASYKIIADDYNDFTIALDVNKLLVPTNPIYAIDTAQNTKVIVAGKDPNRSVPSGIFGSFTDAPGGISEEFKEFYYSTGLEYWYDKQFALRAGFFYENPLKGNRQYFTAGAGLKYNVFNLNFSYLIPTQQRNPLENTLRFSLLFNFGEAEKAPGYYGGGSRKRRK